MLAWQFEAWQHLSRALSSGVRSGRRSFDKNTHVIWLGMGGEQDSQRDTCQPPAAPPLCKKGCGFYGNSVTGMCSKCSRMEAASKVEPVVLDDQRAKMEVANIAIPEPLVKTTELLLPDNRLSPVSSPVQSPGLPDGSCDDAKSNCEVKGRCSACRKKVGLTGFLCKCGQTYCGLHRYSDKHDCTFDYKTLAKESLAKENPLVSADKVAKI